MRDPERIDPVLAVIRRLWKQYPDMRLGQLIVNLAGDATYYTDDEELVLNAHRTLNEGWVR